MIKLTPVSIVSSIDKLLEVLNAKRNRNVQLKNKMRCSTKVMDTYTNAVGEKQKFNKDGTFRWFPGNTIVCDLSNDQNVLNEIHRIQERYRELPFSSKFVYMPIESIHMTVMELLCYFHQEKSVWSSFLDIDAPLEETDAFFAEKLETVDMPRDFAMKVESVGFGHCIWLRPADQATAERLRDFRDKVAQVTGVKFPDHDSYEFHITYAYQLMHLTPEEETHLSEVLDQISSKVKEHLDTVNTGQVLYTVFKDMSRFVPYTPDARALWKSEFEQVNEEMSK
ncbi:MAG: hypothetical protein K0Q73_6785 [Paenibacillus sp.]|nr:hypothetical protein [Paenibacillus sp.]